MKVKDLIDKLKNYNQQTDVCSGYLTNDNKMLHLDLIIKESNPIGDRDAEDKLLLWIGCKEFQFFIVLK